MRISIDVSLLAIGYLYDWCSLCFPSFTTEMAFKFNISSFIIHYIMIYMYIYIQLSVFDIPLIPFTCTIHLLYLSHIQTIPNWWVISLHLFLTRLVIQKRVPSRLASRSRQVDRTKLMERNIFGKIWEDRTCKVVYTCVSLCIFMYAMSGCSSLLIHDIHAYVFICYGHRISDKNDGGVRSI